MIKSNLSVLLAERHLKITKVSLDTGISRTTLTSLASNYSQGIQFETINTLCMYLNITPEQLFIYLPIEIQVKVQTKLEEEIAYVELKVREKNIEKVLPFYCNVYINSNEGQISSYEIIGDLHEPESEEIRNENEEIVRILKKLPPTFLFDVESEIIKEIDERIAAAYLITEDSKLSFSLSFL